MAYVSFDGSTFPLDDVRKNPARFAQRLERAKVSPGFALCLCRPATVNLRLVIRRRRTFYYLAAWPDDAYRHMSGCTFFKHPGRSSLSGAVDRKAAIVATPEGQNVKLEIATNNPASSASARAARRSVTLLTSLKTLWAAAGLHRWNGLAATRHWDLCRALLFAELGDAVLNGPDSQYSVHVTRLRHEGGSAATDAGFDAFIAGLTREADVSKRGVLIGEISEVAPAQ